MNIEVKDRYVGVDVQIDKTVILRWIKSVSEDVLPRDTTITGLIERLKNVDVYEARNFIIDMNITADVECDYDLKMHDIIDFINYSGSNKKRVVEYLIDEGYLLGISQRNMTMIDEMKIDLFFRTMGNFSLEQLETMLESPGIFRTIPS